MLRSRLASCVAPGSEVRAGCDAHAWARQNGQSVRVDADALVRSPEITDAPEIARTKNDSWRVGYRRVLPDSMLDGLDDARSTTQWVQWLRDGYENAGLRAEVRVTTDAARQVVGVSAFGADRDLPNDANRGELWVLYVAPSHWGRATAAHYFAMQKKRSPRRGGATWHSGF